VVYVDAVDRQRWMRRSCCRPDGGGCTGLEEP